MHHILNNVFLHEFLVSIISVDLSSNFDVWVYIWYTLIPLIFAPLIFSFSLMFATQIFAHL